MKPKISENELADILTKMPSNHELLLKRIRQQSFRKVLIYVTAVIYKYDFITMPQIRKKFSVSTRWAYEYLRQLTLLGLLKEEFIVGSNMKEYYPVKDNDGDAIIFRYYKECKKYEESV